MLFLLASSSKPYSEFCYEDVGFRKVSSSMAAIFVFSKKEEAEGLAGILKSRGVHIAPRAITKEELVELQTRLSGGTVKFIFELPGQKPNIPFHHETAGTIEERA